MAWRVAKSLEKLRSQINVRYPGRDKASDGTIGDAAHSASTSDHNPGADGVVEGMDITNDPKVGCVSNDIAEALAASRDPRIKYLISNGRICAGSAGPSPWKWRKYTGKNPHRKHFHISVKGTPKYYDDSADWSAIEPAKKADKTTIVTRAAVAVATAVPVAGQVAETVVGPAEQIREAVTTTGEVVHVAKEIVSIPKPGFWNVALATVTSPAFLICAIVAIAAAWLFVVLWQRRKAAQ